MEEGTKFANALLAADDVTFHQYIEDWKKKQEASDAIAKELYADEAKELGEKYEEELKKAMDGVPDEFKESGKLSAEMFGEGFLERIKEVCEKVKAAVMTEVASVGATMTANLVYAGAGNGGTVNKSFSPTYQFNGAGMTVAQQRRAAQAQAEIDRLRFGV